MFAPNSYVHDRYLIVRTIDGTVYEALDMTSHAQVVLKCIAGGAAADAWPQTERQAEQLRKLRHPALPAMLDAFREGDDAIIVSEFIAGESLAAVVAAEGPLPFEQLARYADQLLSGLQYLHQQNPPILHRSIKPQNILLAPDGTLRLADLGMYGAAQRPQARPSGALGSSLQFMPPEQVQGAALDQRSDIYSLAAVLYYIATGTLPALAGKRINAQSRMQPDPLRPARDVAPQLPPLWGGVLLQALAIDPVQRPATAALLRQALALPSGQATPESQLPTLAPIPAHIPELPPTQPVTITPAATPPSPPAPAGRPPWLLPALISVVGILLLAVVIILIVLREREIEEPPVEVQNITAMPAATAVPSAAANAVLAQPSSAPPKPTAAATAAPAAPAPTIDIDAIEPASAQLGPQAITLTLRGSNLNGIRTARLVSENGPSFNVAVLPITAEQATLTIPPLPSPLNGEVEYRIEINGATIDAPELLLRDFIGRKQVAGVLPEYAYTSRVTTDASGASASMHASSDTASQVIGVLRNGDEVELLRDDVAGWYQVRVRAAAPAAPTGWIERWLVDNQGVPAQPTAEPTTAPTRFVGKIFSAPTDSAVQCGSSFSSSIYGSVEDTRGRGIAGAKLRIRSADGKNVFDRTTTKGGTFSVPGLGCTKWTVQLLSVPNTPGGIRTNAVSVTNLNGGQYTAAEVRFRMQ